MELYYLRSLNRPRSVFASHSGLTKFPMGIRSTPGTVGRNEFKTYVPIYKHNRQVNTREKRTTDELNVDHKHQSKKARVTAAPGLAEQVGGSFEGKPLQIGGSIYAEDKVSDNCAKLSQNVLYKKAIITPKTQILCDGVNFQSEPRKLESSERQYSDSDSDFEETDPYVFA